MGDWSEVLNLLVHFVAGVKYGTVVKETENLTGFLVPDGSFLEENYFKNG